LDKINEIYLFSLTFSVTASASSIDGNSPTDLRILFDGQTTSSVYNVAAMQLNYFQVNTKTKKINTLK
jgi:hypothetical protein